MWKKYDLPKELLTGNACEMLNGELIPRAWYSLSGVGVCTDPDYDSFETFANGNLTRYQYTDNHMGCDLMKIFNAGECFLQALFGQNCKIFLDIVAKRFWTLLHVQIGQSCNAPAGCVINQP